MRAEHAIYSWRSLLLWERRRFTISNTKARAKAPSKSSSTKIPTSAAISLSVWFGGLFGSVLVSAYRSAPGDHRSRW